MLGDEISYQALTINVLYVIIMCIIILIVMSIFKLCSKIKNKKRYITVEKNIQLIYQELEKINEKLDRMYNNDSDDFIDK